MHALINHPFILKFPESAPILKRIRWVTHLIDYSVRYHLRIPIRLHWFIYCWIRWTHGPIVRAQEPKAPVTYCDHALSVVCRPSSVRLSSVCRPLDNLHFRLLLQNRLMDFDETWYGWSTQGPLQVLLFFGQIRPGADPGWGKNRSRGVPFFKKLLLQTGRLQQQTKCIAVI